MYPIYTSSGSKPVRRSRVSLGFYPCMVKMGKIVLFRKACSKKIDDVYIENH